MAGTFSRIKTWIAEVLTASDLNAEFDNIINNLDPDGIDDASATEGAMQAVADPYPASVSSLATNLRGEFQRLRYLIKQITGEAQWYIDPDVSLATIFSTYTTLANIQANAMCYAVDSGAADALVAAFTPAITVLTPGMVLVVKTAAANATTTPTLNAGTGAITITRNSGALLAGDIKANGYSLFQYYTTGWNLLNPILTGTSDIAAGAVTAVKLADAAVTTAKLGAGAVDATKASGILGVWDATKVANTNYQATTDLFISAYATGIGADGTLKILTDSSATPTTVRAYEGDAVETGKTHGVNCFVKKNDYWNVASSSGTVTIHIIPIGS